LQKKGYRQKIDGTNCSFSDSFHAGVVSESRGREETVPVPKMRLHDALHSQYSSSCTGLASCTMEGCRPSSAPSFSRMGQRGLVTPAAQQSTMPKSAEEEVQRPAKHVAGAGSTSTGDKVARWPDASRVGINPHRSCGCRPWHGWSWSRASDSARRVTTPQH